MAARSLILLVLGVLLSGCYSEVELKELTHFEIQAIRGDSIFMHASVRVDNPNEYVIKLKEPDIDVFLNDDTLGKAIVPERFQLDENIERVYEIPVAAHLTHGSKPLLTAALGSVFGVKQMIRVKGTIRGKAGLFSRTIPFEFEHPLELPSGF